MNTHHTHFQSDAAECVLQTVCGNERIAKLPMRKGLLTHNCTRSFVSQLTNRRIQSRKDAVICYICIDRIVETKTCDIMRMWKDFHSSSMTNTYHLHSLCHQFMIVLLISLNIMVETFPTSHHCQCSTCLSNYYKEDSNMEHFLLSAVLWKEEYPDCKFSPWYLFTKRSRIVLCVCRVKVCRWRDNERRRFEV